MVLSAGRRCCRTDLALSGVSMETRANADPLLTKKSLDSTARLYLGGHDPRDPFASLCMVIWPGCHRSEFTWVKTKYS
jgi:hypothetical protein